MFEFEASVEIETTARALELTLRNVFFLSRVVREEGGTFRLLADGAQGDLSGTFRLESTVRGDGRLLVNLACEGFAEAPEEIMEGINQHFQSTISAVVDQVRVTAETMASTGYLTVVATAGTVIAVPTALAEQRLRSLLRLAPGAERLETLSHEAEGWARHGFTLHETAEGYTWIGVKSSLDIPIDGPDADHAVEIYNRLREATPANLARLGDRIDPSVRLLTTEGIQSIA